jgi:predicted nucleic acid-binding protein
VPHFLDTNVLVYALSSGPTEALKRTQAQALLDLDDGALSAQVLQEFYVQITRATRPQRLSHKDAVDFITVWRRFPVQDMTLSILVEALEIKARHGFSYWDSAIIAAARALGCDRLYTEDLSHGREVEGITIINPFR